MHSKITLILFILFFVSQPSYGDSSRLLQSQISGDTALPANMFNINGLWDVHYEFLPVGNITIAIKFNTPNQFFGLGLGTQMAGADIWVFQIENGQVTASDRHGVGHIEPAIDVSSGGKEDLQVLGYEVNPAYSLIKFTRLLDTGDINDRVIQPGLTDFIYATAVGSPVIAYHGPTRGTLQVELVDNAAVVESENENLETEGIEELNTEFENDFASSLRQFFVQNERDFSDLL